MLKDWRRWVLLSSAAAAAAAAMTLSEAAPAGPKLVVELPKDRRGCGRIKLLDSKGKTASGPFVACGIADGTTAKKHKNATRSTILPFGDTPTGQYSVSDTFKVGEGTSYRAASYGDYGAIRLKPTGGDAKLAEAAGRTGLLIHGGDPGAAGKLRPTNGCVRMSNGDLHTLIDDMQALAIRDAPLSSCQVDASVSVDVTEPAPDSGYDEGDPPPTGSTRPLP